MWKRAQDQWCFHLLPFLALKTIQIWSEITFPLYIWFYSPYYILSEMAERLKAPCISYSREQVSEFEPQENLFWGYFFLNLHSVVLISDGSENQNRIFGYPESVSSRKLVLKDTLNKACLVIFWEIFTYLMIFQKFHSTAQWHFQNLKPRFRAPDPSLVHIMCQSDLWKIAALYHDEMSLSQSGSRQ